MNMDIAALYIIGFIYIMGIISHYGLLKNSIHKEWNDINQRLAERFFLIEIVSVFWIFMVIGVITYKIMHIGKKTSDKDEIE